MALGRIRRAGRRLTVQLNDSGGWQIVYTGFCLIMLCFFIMLTSFASLEPSKITRFVGSFSNAVSIFDGGRGIEPGDIVQDGSVQLLPKEDLTMRLFEKVQQVSREEGLDQVRLHRSSRGVVMTLKEKLLFASGQARISVAARKRLEKIARLIQQVDVPVEIEGHTDDRSIHTEDFGSNWDLSTARAVSVLRFLTETLNIDSRRLSAAGYAEYQPLVPNDSETHRAMNRRVDFVFKTEG